MENVSLEQELLDLRRDGKVTEDEYRQLLAAMRTPTSNGSTKPTNISKKHVLWIALAAVVIAGGLFLMSMISDVDKTEVTSVPNKSRRGRLVDKIDYPFINDPEVIGTWKRVDFVRAINDFKVGEKSGRDDLYLKSMMFNDDGSTVGPWIWTKGLIIHPGSQTASKYIIKEIGGEQYMFFEWKAGDYTIRRMKPKYYVLKKVSETVTKPNLPRSKARPRPSISSIKSFDDIRSKDISGLDFSVRNVPLEKLTFNQETVWPPPARMPTVPKPNELITMAMNPGLGVRQLHRQGITGKGVNVAIIDQPLHKDHPEYDGKIAAYYDAGCGGSESSMHGPAVASLLVGKNCGSAPDAKVYYAAAPSWTGDAAYYAKSLNWIIKQNEKLSASEKIRVVSVSAAPSGPGSPFTKNNKKWDKAYEHAREAGILILDCTSRGFINRAWYDLDDMENVAKCTPGSPGYPPSTDTEGIYVPASCRTTAQHYDYHGRDSYIYWGRGGLSWSIPYCTGVLAMGWQVRPELTGEQMVDLLFQTAYTKKGGAQIINPPAFINLLLEN